MASLTTTQTGPLSSSSTLGGATFVNGDDITVASGHVLTVDVAATVGAAGADGTTAFVLVGSLTISAALTVRGDISQQRTSTVTIGANVTWHPPSGGTYKWVTPNTGTGSPSIVFAGSAGTRVVVTTNLASGGNRFYFDFSAYPPNVSGSYGEVSEVGGTGDTTATRAMTYVGVSGCSFAPQYVRFVMAGKFHFDFSGLGSYTMNPQRCCWRGPRHASQVLQIIADTARSAGTRHLENCTYHASSLRSITTYARDFTFSGVASNVKIGMDIYDLNNTVQTMAFFYDVVVNGMVSSRSNNGLTVQHCPFLIDQTGSDNPHYFVQSGSAGGSGSVFFRNIYDGNGVEGSDSGDIHISDGTVRADRCISLNRAGTLFPSNEVSVRITGVRNTMCNTSGINGGETSSGASQFVRYSSNVHLDMADGIHQESTFVAQSSWNLDYNAAYNISTSTNFDIAGSNGYLGAATYATWKTGATYGDDNFGQHDRYADPQMVDKTRTAVTWYNANVGSGGSFANVRARVLEMNDTAADGSAATFNTAFAVDNWLTYQRRGLTPTNAVFRAAGDPDDGSPDLGAEDMDLVAAVRRVVAVMPPQVVMC